MRKGEKKKSKTDSVQHEKQNCGSAKKTQPEERSQMKKGNKSEARVVAGH